MAKNLKYPLILVCGLVLTLLPRQGWTQTAAPAKPQTPIAAAFTLLDSLFNRPSFLLVNLGPDIPADMQPILTRFNNALATNQQWFNEYRNKYSDQPLPYDPRFGISAEEYRRVLRLGTNPPALVPIDSQTVIVLKDDGIIRFECSNNEDRFLNYLFIDPAHHLLGYGSDTIPFAGPTESGPKSLYGQWQGYLWRLEPTPNKNATDTSPLTGRVVEVIFGTLPDGKKTFIRISYQNIQGGTAISQMELLGYIL